MKRDIELIKKILIILEERDKPDFIGVFEIEDIDKETVDYHLELTKDAGLIKGSFSYAGDGLYEIAIKLTNDGHDFILAAKNDNIWSQFKRKLGSDIQSVPLAVAVPLLIDLSKNYFKSLMG